MNTEPAYDTHSQPHNGKKDLQDGCSVLKRTATFHIRITMFTKRQRAQMKSFSLLRPSGTGNVMSLGLNFGQGLLFMLGMGQTGQKGRKRV